MISITRLLELKKDLAIAQVIRICAQPAQVTPNMTEALGRLGAYTDILADYLRIQQGSA